MGGKQKASASTDDEGGEAAEHDLKDKHGLAGLYVPGELLSLGLDCTHRHEPTTLTCSSHNPGAWELPLTVTLTLALTLALALTPTLTLTLTGAWEVGKEIVRAVTGVTLVRDDPNCPEASPKDVEP